MIRAALLVALVAAPALAQQYPSRGRMSAPAGYTAGQASSASETGWTADGGSTATTLRVASGGGGYSTDGGYLFTGPTAVEAIGITAGALICTATGELNSCWRRTAANRIDTPGNLLVTGDISTGASGDIVPGRHVLATGKITSGSSLTKGTITLAAGTGTATVTSGVKCVCGTETANPVSCAVVTTTLTCTGTGTELCNYVCL